MSAIDALAGAKGLDLREPEARDIGPSPIADTPELGLRERGIGTILWASGLRPDDSWIHLDVTDEYGWPVQQRGVSERARRALLHRRELVAQAQVGALLRSRRGRRARGLAPPRALDHLDGDGEVSASLAGEHTGERFDASCVEELSRAVSKVLERTLV